jgi:FMN-dependent NADH-azoreductase
MSKLLYIQASLRADRSHSRKVADSFVEAYRKEHRGAEILTLDLFQRDLPAFDGEAVNAKYRILHGEKPTEAERKAWRAVEAVIFDFTAAEKYVFAVPMWNFGIPYRLKQYLDILVQPTYTFSYTPEEGYKGIITGRPVFVAYARGGAYSAGTEAEGYDFQKPYLETILGFMGMSDIRSVVVEPTLQEGPHIGKAKRDEAIAKAQEMARQF